MVKRKKGSGKRNASGLGDWFGWDTGAKGVVCRIILNLLPIIAYVTKKTVTLSELSIESTLEI